MKIPRIIADIGPTGYIGDLNISNSIGFAWILNAILNLIWIIAIDSHVRIPDMLVIWISQIKISPSPMKIERKEIHPLKAVNIIALIGTPFLNLVNSFGAFPSKDQIIKYLLLMHKEF